MKTSTIVLKFSTNICFPFISLPVHLVTGINTREARYISMIGLRHKIIYNGSTTESESQKSQKKKLIAALQELIDRLENESPATANSKHEQHI